MEMKPAGLQPHRRSEGKNDCLKQSFPDDVVDVLSSIELRCVECAHLSSLLDHGLVLCDRCACGGELDIECTYRRPAQVGGHVQDVDEVFFKEEAGGIPMAGALWRQLFDERISASPIWSIGSDSMQLDYSGVWRYRELIFPVPEEYVITRPEGNTGLYPVGIENCGPSRIGHKQIGNYVGLERLYLKHEGENPTGSLYDRGMAVALTIANMLGTRVVICTAADAASSLASYAAQAGERAVVFLPTGDALSRDVAHTLAYGAKVVPVNGDLTTLVPLIERAYDKFYIMNFPNPFLIEGQKTVGFELLQQLDWQAPDWLVLSGDDLGRVYAVGKALRQAYHLSLINHIPRIAVIRASTVDPLYQDFKRSFAELLAGPASGAREVAYTQARRILEECDGVVEVVDVAEAFDAKHVVDRAGIGCDLSSAATLAGIRKLVTQGVIKHDEQVVAVATGHLFKDMEITAPGQIGENAIDPTLDAIRSVLMS